MQQEQDSAGSATSASGSDSNRPAASLQLPKGGGAIRGIGEKFAGALSNTEIGNANGTECVLTMEGEPLQEADWNDLCLLMEYEVVTA